MVVRQGNENKRAQANTALQMISRRLTSKLSKGLPFPKPVSRQREDDFDFEKIIDRNRRLETQLTSELDANKLLDESLNSELARLESEKKLLASLEANAKAQSSLRRSASGKQHPVLQWTDSAEAEDLDMSSTLGAPKPSLGVSFSLNLLHPCLTNCCQFSADEDIRLIVRDLESHVDSLHGNFEPLKGLPESIARTKAAVQIAILDQLGEAKCEDVVMGS